MVPKREDPMSWGWFAMVPWAGRIKDGKIRDKAGIAYQLPTHWDPPHAEHGYGFHSEWRMSGENLFELDLPEPYAPGIVRQRFELKENRLIWSLEYIPNGCTLPAWVGFHPWLPRSIDDLPNIELNFKAEQMLIRGVDYIPTGEFTSVHPGNWDDAFTGLKDYPVITWGERARMRIESEVPWWVVYNEDPLGICVEPQTAPPDAANLEIQGEHKIEAIFTFSKPT